MADRAAEVLSYSYVLSSTRPTCDTVVQFHHGDAQPTRCRRCTAWLQVPRGVS